MAGIGGLASSEQARRVTDWRMEGVEDGRAKGSSAIGDRGQAAISLTSNVVGIYIHIFESSQFEGLYVGYLLYGLCYTK